MDNRIYAEIARNTPRNRELALLDIKGECANPALAADGVYCFLQGGTVVHWPSARLAEAMAQEWGNLLWAVEEVSRTAKEATLKGYAWDLEKNLIVSESVKVPLLGLAADGKRLMGAEAAEAIAQQSGRVLRRCICRLIPHDVIAAAVEACNQSLKPDKEEVTGEAHKNFR